MWQPPRHQLDRIEVTVRLPDEPDPTSTSIAVHGRSSTKRSDLWTYQEYFDDTVTAAKGYGVGDALHHIVLVCMQDRPNTLERLQFSLRGGIAYEQGELPI